jgi:hypothetical protein
MFSIPYVQSRLLQALAGYANGSRELYLEAEISRGFLVTAARRLHLLRAPQGKPIRFNAQTVGGPSRIEPGDVPIRLSVQQTDNRAQTESLERDLERRWKRWLDQEERRRLGWGIYVSFDFFLNETFADSTTQRSYSTLNSARFSTYLTSLLSRKSLLNCRITKIDGQLQMLSAGMPH